MAKVVQLMDVTVREGSTVIGYQWSAGQVAEIAKAIDEAGIPYMEVGNGGGLGVSDDYYRGIQPQSTDIEQIRAAKKWVKRCQIGFMANPQPFTQPEHIEAVKGKVDFLRIAARIDDIEAAKGNVETANRCGIPVFFQMMRSSKFAPKEIVKAARQAASFGPQAVYLVDTNGYFLPDEVSAIIADLKKNLKTAVGFHAHNNLGLAVANSLAAVQAGADFVDASLLGLGRDSGNATLEALVAALQRKGQAKKIDFKKLITAAGQFIQPIIPSQAKLSPLMTAQGQANVCCYPIDFYLQIVHAAGVDFLDFLDVLGRDPATEPDTKKALRTMGKDADKIFKKLGLG